APSSRMTRPDHRQFCHAIGIRLVQDAQLPDLVDILRQLPTDYPDPAMTKAAGRTKSSEPIVLFTRWVIARINRRLSSYGRNSQPELEEEVPLVAYAGDRLGYVIPPDPAFFADNRYRAAEWRDYLPFVPLDSDWQDAARYLNFTFIS